ncbi:MAG: GNAT family N-acetyltransferase [Pseudonocardiaceae bacterium]|nr:GNAT family N-acetyltransferase [Pseudonocardiaceae bacterium]
MRTAEIADARAIAGINVAAWQFAYRGIVEQSALDAMDPADRLDGWRDMLSRQFSEETFFVATNEAGVLGAYCGVGPARNQSDVDDQLTGELIAIYADPRYQGSGAGHAVHEAAMVHLADRGFQNTVLWVMADNSLARKFYESHGWRADGVEDILAVAGKPIRVSRYGRDLLDYASSV